jgi:uncharacterized protein YjbI with pentapeptide repeats
VQPVPPEQVRSLLCSGSAAWNAWREQSRAAVLDRRGLDLSGLDLSGADLARCNLHGAKLDSANLRRADLQHADLVGARLFRAELGGANLRGANLRGAFAARATLDDAELGSASLHSCNLQGASLRRANLEFSLLIRCDLRGANLAEATCCGTAFAQVALSGARNLHRMVHRGPSSLGLEVLMDLSTHAQSEFLRGCGVEDDMLLRLSELRTSELERYYSAFISYSHQDRAFARRLHDHLQRAGVRCWLDERQMLPGDNVYNRIAEGVLDNERVLLCASEHSLSSWWVNAEIEAALAKERELARSTYSSVQILIPIDLDGSMFCASRSGAKFLLLQSRVAADFTDRATFEAQIDRLRLALRRPHESPADTVHATR